MAVNLSPPLPAVDAPLSDWFAAYHRTVCPDATKKTVYEMTVAYSYLRLAFSYEPTISDLTTDKLNFATEILKDEGYSQTQIEKILRFILALWRWVAEIGQPVNEPTMMNPKLKRSAPEVLPTKKRKPKRLKNVACHRFKRWMRRVIASLTGIDLTRGEPLPAVPLDRDEWEITLPTIDGPTAAELEQSRINSATYKAARQAAVRELAGIPLFGWLALYLQWAEIIDKPGAVKQWRFALRWFSGSIGHAPTIDDLTVEAVRGVEPHMVAHGLAASSARLVMDKLAAAWRFAWEAGAIATPPTVLDNRRLANKWAQVRLGRPVVKGRKGKRRRATWQRKRICERPGCNQEFIPTKRKQRTCSGKCWKAVMRQQRTTERGDNRTTLICEHCGRPFKALKKTTRTCSPKCRMARYEQVSKREQQPKRIEYRRERRRQRSKRRQPAEEGTGTP